MTEPGEPRAAEQLREALAGLQRARARERRTRVEAEALLEGLQVLSDYEQRETLFGRLLLVLQGVIGFEEALVLVGREDHQLRVVATTSPRFEQVVWPMDGLVERMVPASPVALVDVAAAEEWRDQPTSIRAGIGSSLHVLLRTGRSPAVLVCTHSQRGFFTSAQLRLAARFAPLASQALKNLDTLQKLEELNEQLQLEIAVRRRAEAVAAKSREQIIIASKMAALGEMAGGVAHEINNPLAIISSLSGQLSELLEEERMDRAEGLSIIAAIEATTARIGKIVNGLRSFSRNGSKDPCLTISVRRLVEDTLVLCVQRFHHADIALQVDEIPDDLAIECRPTQLSQVLLNLLNNAYDAVDRLPTRWVRISARVADDTIDLAVIDSGLGIVGPVEQRMFQPFFTTKDVGAGTGLGLSISKGLVESHGGELFVDRTSEHTCFVVRLPRLQAPRDAASVRSGSAPPSAPPSVGRTP